MVRAIHPGRVVDEVRVDPAAGERILDPTSLGESEVAALGHHAAPQSVSVDTHVVVHPVADVLVGFGRGLHVRADPAVPEQVHGSPEDRLDDLIGGEGLPIDAERSPGLRRQGDALAVRGHTPPPSEIFDRS